MSYLFRPWHLGDRHRAMTERELSAACRQTLELAPEPRRVRREIPRGLLFASWWERRGSVHAALLGVVAMLPGVYAAGLADRPIWQGLVPTVLIWMAAWGVTVSLRARWGAGL